MINLGTCSDNIFLYIVHGGYVGLVMMAHVSLVSISQGGQVVFDQCWSETSDGGELFTALECHEESC